MKAVPKAADIIIIIIVCALTFLSASFVYFNKQGRALVLIRAESSEWVFPLNSEEKIVMQGPLGDTVARIANNRAWIESSPCNNQTCVALGFVSRQGQWAACLPNNTLLMIYGVKEKKEDVDTIVW